MDMPNLVLDIHALRIRRAAWSDCWTWRRDTGRERTVWRCTTHCHALATGFLFGIGWGERRIEDVAALAGQTLEVVDDIGGREIGGCAAGLGLCALFLPAWIEQLDTHVLVQLGDGDLLLAVRAEGGGAGALLSAGLGAWDVV